MADQVNLLVNVKGFLLGTKAAVEAASSQEGYIGYATDTNEFGSYSGSVWTWGQGGSGFPNPFALTSDITPAALSADENDYNPTGLSTADILRLSASGAARTITGLAGGADGRVIVIYNVGSLDIVLASESTSSSAANRFTTRHTDGIRISASCGAILQYDSTSSRWRQFGIQDHNDLSNGGSAYTHSQIETFIDVTAPSTYMLLTGWRGVNQTWTYASADDPVYQIYVSGDVTANADYKVGNKVKCTHNTSVLFQGLIVKVGAYDSGNNRTPVDLYGGTDYDLTNTTITATYISKVKSPDGFPMNPDKWTVSVTDSNACTKSSPTANTWYGDTGLSSTGPSINIPIGSWIPSYHAVVRIIIDLSGGAGNAGIKVTLSTSSSTESDSNHTRDALITLPALSNAAFRISIDATLKTITLTSKTTHYLNIQTPQSPTSISILGNILPTTIKLLCAYL